MQPHPLSTFPSLPRFLPLLWCRNQESCDELHLSNGYILSPRILDPSQVLISSFLCVSLMFCERKWGIPADFLSQASKDRNLCREILELLVASPRNCRKNMTCSPDLTDWLDPFALFLLFRPFVSSQEITTRVSLKEKCSETTEATINTKRYKNKDSLGLHVVSCLQSVFLTLCYFSRCFLSELLPNDCCSTGCVMFHLRRPE